MDCGVRKKRKKTPFALMCEKVNKLEKEKADLEKEVADQKENNALNALDILRLRGII